METIIYYLQLFRLTQGNILSFFKLAKETFTNRNLVAVTVMQTLFMFTAFLWWPYRSLYIRELGATNEQLGLLLTVETVTNLIFQYPGGVLADKYGRRKLIILGSILRLLSPISFLLATDWTHIVPAMILSSSAMIGFPARMALITESIPAGNRSSGLAIFRTVTSIPMIITSLMGGVIVDYYGVIDGIHLILLASAATAVLSIVVSSFFITETMVEGSKQKKKTSTSIGQRIREASHMPRQVWIITLIATLSMFSARMVWSFMVIYGIEEVGITKTEWGLIGTFVSLISTLITTPSGVLSDRLGRKKIILASRITSTLSTLGFTFSQNFWHMSIVRGLGGIGSGMGGAMMGPMGGPVWQALVADLTPINERGRMMGIMGTVGSLGSIPASWIGGYMYDNISPELPFYSSFILDMVGSAIFLVAVKEPNKDSRED